MNLTSPVQAAPSTPRLRARRWPLRSAAGLVTVVAIVAAILVTRNQLRPANPLALMARTVVHRTDMGSTLTASGLTESGHNTVIACQLERLDFRSGGGTEMSTGGASVIIDLIDEGTMVKQGDILCRLDSSDYEELVRQQTIKVDQARAAVVQARLDLDVAELGVREHVEGLDRQSSENMEGEIVLSEANLERSVERLNWTSRMLEKGYASLAQRAAAERAVTLARLSLTTAHWKLDLYRKFGNPKSVKVLSASVEKCRFNLISNERRLTRMTERLQYYRTMVEYCTIRAPHDGFLVYATDPNKPSIPRIEVGSTVRQAQKLFFLPNLSDMTVLAYLHESVAQRVQPGMATRVTLDGLGGTTLPGKVFSVAPLPVAASSGWLSSGEVKFFVGVVKLDPTPLKIRPGLTAHVEVDIDRREDVLAIPSEALAVREGRDVCYVASVEGIERRSITIGRSTRDLLEVTSGLSEGEQVVTQPGRVESIDDLVVAGRDETPISSAETTGSSSIGSASSAEPTVE